MSDQTEEPKLEPRRRRRARPSAAPIEEEPATSVVEPEGPSGGFAATSPSAGEESYKEDLPAVPHPASVPARPGTPPPPPGPPGTFVPKPPAPARPRSSVQLTIGIGLVVVGALALLSQFGLLWWVDGRLIWPVVLIAAGLILLYRRGLR